MKTALLLLACALAAPAQTIPSQRLAWLLSYAGKSTNAVVWDSRFRALLDAAVPRASFALGMLRNGKSPLRSAVKEELGGPPEGVVVRDGRFVQLAACRAHSCTEKGFLWVDVQQGVVIGAVSHYFFNSNEWTGDHAMLLIYSRQLDAASLPAAFQQDLKAWIESQQLDVTLRRFVGANGTVSPM